MLKQFFSFLLHPNLSNEPRSLNVHGLFVLLGRFLLAYFGLAILSSLIFFPILRMMDLLPESKIATSEIPLSFKLIVFVPIYEEAIFRLPLRFTKRNLAISLAALFFLVFYHVFELYMLIAIAVFIALIPSFITIPAFVILRAGIVWKKYFPLLYYGLALSFGILHLFNFENLRLAHFLVFPFIVFNQIVMGLMLGYIRVEYKYGFIYSIILHFLINLPLILLSHL